MSENVAVIASVLKPVDDTRLYEKLGLSIRETKKYRVNIIGFAVKNPPRHPGMEFHGIYSGSRLYWTRLLVPWRFLVKLIEIKRNCKHKHKYARKHSLDRKQKPTLKLLIVCTPELLFPAVLYKIIFGTRLWYDVQENYRRNVQYQSVYFPWLKPLLKLMLRMVETISRPFIDHYLLAERGYLRELKFVNGRYTVLENKYKSIQVYKKNSNHQHHRVRLIFSGTCSWENGILEAVSLAEALIQRQYPVQLDIAGQVPDPDILQFLYRKAEFFKGQITMAGGNGALMGHSVIMEHAARADFGLVAHQPNPSNENCIPTKIYEYLGLKLPILLQSHPLWESVIRPYQGGLVLDFNQFHPDELWKKMCDTEFYTKIPGSEICWEQEEQKLLTLLSE